ncbi:MAG: pyridoxal phosphate-dependent aminotransferase [Armatimonadota bacterium]|nr:pyridoxal phosphate-dependent aminotransferase [Armatimonadota bacterium]MDR7449914.1 pyridoxal phosphate-dependent aminotransferase [Armatimonadota bacterium]MDR7460093.1 pyridoxal phosphate-dependent aminotransferase [Armatimonadota bacterium]MDR7480626.1 pyridoxal phosphate-dependent aminotransferase [Armatimonadota bacterium]MDR7488384.1 pyridoxal phosphate-dependent aminotransferase [Armatimonadota bacterium]
MEARLAERMALLGTETAFEVLARAKELERQGRHIVHLEVGEPDFDTPAHIKDAAVRALQEGYTHYTPTAGLWEAREVVAEYVARTRRIPVQPQEVVLTTGAKPVMFFAMLMLVEPGDEVVVPNPGYPIYESMARFAGGAVKPLPLRERNDFRVDPEELRSLLSPRTRLVVLNSPHNPCGSVLTADDLTAIAEAVQRTNAWVLSDEIYGRITYGVEAPSIASLPGMQERTIILDGFSKTYAMTGWRLGYGVMPAALAERMTQLATNATSCPAAFTQVAGMEALRGPQDAVDRMVAEFRRRRDHIVQGLNAIEGITCRTPLGAFYVFPNVTGVDVDSQRFASFLLNEMGVAVLAGTAFGSSGQGYLRLSYAASIAAIDEGLQRIAEGVRRYRTVARA